MVKTVVVLSIIAVSSAAFTQPVAPDKLDKWVGVLVAKPADAAKRFDACEALILPSGELRTPCKLSASDLAGTDKDITLKATKMTSKRFPRSMLSWNEADVDVLVAKKKVNTFHVLEVTSDDVGGGILLQYWAKLIPDKDALAKAKAGTLKAPTITAGRQAEPSKMGDQDKNDRANALDTLEQTASDKDDQKDFIAAWAESGSTIIGSAPGQRWTGKAAAKQIKAWKMDLKFDGKPASGGTAMVQWAYAKSVGTTKDKTPVSIPYDTLMVTVNQMTPGGSMSPANALFVFSVPQ